MEIEEIEMNLPPAACMETTNNEVLNLAEHAAHFEGIL
jgi:hypothetical protein